MARRSEKRNASTMAPAPAPNDDDTKRFALDDQHLDLIGYDREKLQDFHSRVEEAIRSLGTRDRAKKREEYARLDGRVIERLAALSNQQITSSVQEAPVEVNTSKNKRTAAGGDDEEPTSMAVRRSKRSKKSVDHLKAQQLLQTTAPGVDIGSGLAMAVVDVDSEDNDDDVLNSNEKDKHDPMDKQIMRAKQQLDSFRSALHERLLRAKQWLCSLQATPDEADSMAAIQAAIDYQITATAIPVDLDQVTEMEAAPHVTNECKLMTDKQAASEKELSMANVHAALDESHWIPELEANLAQRRVEPFFHALSLPEVFLNSRRSRSVVTLGEVDEQRTVELDESGENLSEVVNDNGIGARFITDDGMATGSKWKFSPKQSGFAAELVNTEAEMLGEDVECTKISSFPFKINPDDVSYELLTRPESRGVVSDIFCRFAKEHGRGSVAAITGSPGIGKSWTLFHALQQALLYDGATVLFFFQKKKIAVLYLRRKNKLYAWTSKSKGTAVSNLFERSDVLVLLDPREADQGGAAFEVGEMKLLYAASNNKAHISTVAVKSNGKMQAYLGPPQDGELHVMLGRIAPSLTQDVIEERRKIVGNLMRYILDEFKYEDLVKTTAEKVAECAKNRDLLDEALRTEGMSNGGHTVPGTLFQVLPRWPDDTPIGYDGLEVKYRERVIKAVNEEVFNAIVSAGREIILTYWGKVSSDEYARMGKLAERLFIKDLTNADGLVMKRYLQGGKGQKKESQLEVGRGMIPTEDVTMNGVCAEVLMKENVVAEMAENSHLIDAAGPGRKVYQVTVSTSHRMSLTAMEKLGRELGYIGQGAKFFREKLEFHWVVPEGIASVWKEKAPYKYKGPKDKAKKDTVNRFLERHVNQYVLPMTYKNPMTFLEFEIVKNRDNRKSWP